MAAAFLELTRPYLQLDYSWLWRCVSVAKFDYDQHTLDEIHGIDANNRDCVRIPGQRCHLIQAKAATRSTAKLPPIPVKVAPCDGVVLALSTRDNSTYSAASF